MMGTINYGSNEYINIGANPNNYWIEDENGDNIFLDFEMDDDYQNIKSLLDNYNFYYFNVTIEPGYYEGFYIDINFDYLWVDAYEKPEILKELTQLKKFLLKCAGYGLLEYYPGWCMGYSDYKNTIESIKNMIRDTKQNILKYPTYKTYKKGA